MEKVGRPLDAASVYEKELKMYDKARALREKDKQVAVKHMDITVNLNDLLRQFKDGGIVAVYRCPHCGGKLKVDKNVDIAKLKVCEHCGSEIESMDLADFLKTALS
jgi:DNA-directed RNA polymerase subunit RPC12/RpoP